MAKDANSSSSSASCWHNKEAVREKETGREKNSGWKMNNVLILIVQGLKTITRGAEWKQLLMGVESCGCIKSRIDYRGLHEASQTRSRCSMDCMYSCRCHVFAQTELSANQSTQPCRGCGW